MISKGSDQIAQMHRLILVFPGPTSRIVGFVVLWFISNDQQYQVIKSEESIVQNLEKKQELVP